MKGLTQLHPDDPRGAARHLRRAGPPGDHRAPAAHRRHRHRADAGAPVPPRLDADREGPAQLLGLQHDRLLRAAQRLLVGGRAGPAGPGVQGHGAHACTTPGIEVILDVVYNHTAEGNHLGPTVSFKGIDNEAYYRLVDDDPQHYMDYTGTGNSLNVRHPHSLQLIMDSLRYWVTEMHVDGFRFDLASTLAREFYEVDKLSTFFELVQQDPTISPGQADRRAVGRRPRWLPGRQLPAAVDGVERQVPRHRPRPVARRAGVARRVRLPVHRFGRPVRAATAAGPWRRSTSSPPTTGSRSPTSSRTTRSTTTPTARTTTTASRTTGRGTAASRDRPTTRRSRRCAPVSSATSWPRCCCRRACR